MNDCGAKLSIQCVRHGEFLMPEQCNAQERRCIQDLRSFGSRRIVFDSFRVNKGSQTVASLRITLAGALARVVCSAVYTGRC